jgi:RimJ/RimL family protein N-acetyltransferase
MAVTLTAPVLTTARCLLRPLAARDFAAFAALHDSPHARLMWVFPNRDAAWERFLALAGGWTALGSGGWAVTDRWSDAFLGHTGFFHGQAAGVPELIWALTAAAEGKGYAEEAVRAARGWGRRNGMATPVSHIDAGNTRSIRLAERLGAVLEGRTSFAPGAEALHFRHPGGIE